MKVELRRSLDGYYEELDALARKYRGDLHAVKTDKSLSGFGKEKRAGELRNEFTQKLAELRGKFDDDVAGRVSGIGAALRPQDARAERPYPLVPVIVLFPYQHRIRNAGMRYY